MRFAEKNQKKNRRGGATRVIAVGFLVAILLGTLLLMLPFATKEGKSTSWSDALFTAVSCTCVTGLSVFDTATHWSIFGQSVMMVLIQVGGLGFMTLAVLLSWLFRRSVTPRERMLVAASYNLNSFESIQELVKRIIFGTLIIEGAGAVLLFTRFVTICDSIPSAIYKSVFTAISAFCNAGFDVAGDLPGAGEGTSLSLFVADPMVNITLIVLILFGGIGFFVWNDFAVCVKNRTKRKLRPYTLFVLYITAILTVGGSIFFAVTEWNNPATIGNFSVGNKILASVFHTVSLRTAGFYTVNNADMSSASKVLSTVYMFIGGASGSTAGGVKLVTVGVVIVTVWSVFVGKEDTVLFGRSISRDTFLRAVSVVIIQFAVICISVILMVVWTDFGLTQVVYEAVSAVSTVGLSLGITADLALNGRIVLIILMYFGRVGVLTVSYAVLSHVGGQEPAVRYPDADFLIG